jgi:hypothetical protein
MERISALIEKLREQFAAGADIEQLLLSTQLLEGELRYHLQKGTVPASPHVAVVLPGTHRPIPSKIPEPEQDLPQEQPVQEERPEPARVAAARPAYTEPAQAPARPVYAEPARPAYAEPARPAYTEPPAPAYQPAAQTPPARPAAELPQEHAAYQPQARPAYSEPPAPPAAPVTPPARPVYAEPQRPAARESEPARYNPIREVPTLTHQIPQEARGRELNDVMAGESSRSLNDTWKEQKPEQKEVIAKFTETPVRDLRKAVGINDRYLFISELFRGDETMYERSIKTINNFSIFQEAYYWMERELKLKLAWDQDKYSTQLFYQLVRRRFTT